LSAEVSKQKPGQSGLLALDWNNGNRTILVDPMLSGLLVGQTLHTTKAEIYRALIEATAFGARAIIERIKEYGVPIDRIVCAGGIARKDAMLMQIYADVTGCTMQVTASDQACALGSAVSAAVLAGAHPDFETAQKKMTRLERKQYRPDPVRQKTYNEIYRLYRILHDAFGGLNRSADMSTVMKDLLALKESSQAKR
jgi:L-ribulokinase